VVCTQQTDLTAGTNGQPNDPQAKTPAEGARSQSCRPRLRAAPSVRGPGRLLRIGLPAELRIKRQHATFVQLENPIARASSATIAPASTGRAVSPEPGQPPDS
jgi:hypothetical protein